MIATEGIHCARARLQRRLDHKKASDTYKTLQKNGQSYENKVLD